TPEAAPAAPTPSAKPGTPVKAPIVGTFYAASSPDAAAFVKVGDRVEVGQVMCIIEAMKLMNEIESEVAGTVREILVKNAEPVEYGQTLFIVE
ncbi:acetyl-CoA carboxylase biotin carboxyl carrier protein, partial [Deinococcus pimensis]|uniref:acetyl-CoA carboxylase biotin carboxyl carrier protein n=1 Tax=Deinococcus pimensis TaxID=309888 RepID=UPI000A02C0D6